MPHPASRPAAARVAAGLALAPALVALAASPARADSVAIAPPAGAVFGVETRFAVTVATDHPDATLSVVASPASEPPCSPTAQEDWEAANARGRSRTTLAFEPRVASGVIEVAARFEQPGRHRLCAWLDRGSPPIPLAAGAAELEVGGASGTLRARARTATSSPRGVLLAAELRGEARPATAVSAVALPARRACPELPGDARAAAAEVLMPPSTSLVGPGAFSATLRTRRPLPHGRWRVCAYLMAGAVPDAGPAAARAEATVVTGFRPAYSVEDRPRIAWAARRTLRCDRGRWTAIPRPVLSVSWSRDGRRLAGERRWTLRSRGNGTYRCRVLARNRHGTTVALAPPFPVQPWIGR